MFEVRGGNLYIFGMDVDKVFIAGVLSGIVLFLQGDHIGGILAIIGIIGGNKALNVAKSFADAMKTSQNAEIPKVK